MEFKEITDLIKLVSKSNLSDFKLRDGDFEISIRTDKHGKFKFVESAPTNTQMPVSASMPSAPAAMASTEPQPMPEKSKADLPTDSSEETDAKYLEIRSPMVGTFYRSPSPDKSPYLKVGDTIEVGSVVCIVEAMKLFNEIESEISGTLVKVMAEDASPVEYDQVLFLIEP
jgi:acetyl-CoA carboxylase biotin carboxyl carrier protein